MSIVINKTEETLALLEKEDKVKTMDSPEEVDAILAVDKIMEEVGRDYQIKDNNSQITSATVILTA